MCLFLFVVFFVFFGVVDTMIAAPSWDESVVALSTKSPRDCGDFLVIGAIGSPHPEHFPWWHSANFAISFVIAAKPL